MADERHDGGVAGEGRNLTRAHVNVIRPSRLRCAEQFGQRGERLAIGASRIEEPGAIEVIALLQAILYTSEAAASSQRPKAANASSRQPKDSSRKQKSQQPEASSRIYVCAIKFCRSALRDRRTALSRYIRSSAAASSSSNE